MEVLFFIFIVIAVIAALANVSEAGDEGGFRTDCRQRFDRHIDANGRVYYISSSGKKVYCKPDGSAK